jgi:rare lipoprotein A (peptidoglycan hydrolase)
MSLRRTARLALIAVVTACLLAPSAVPAAAAPTATEVAADRAVLDEALARYDTAQAEAAAVEARVAEASAELDRLVAEEAACQARLQSRVSAMYRATDADTLSLLLGASNLQQLAERLDLLERIARQSNENLKELKAARAAAETAAEDLLPLQAEQAQKLAALEQEVATARQELAASESALREYEEQMAAKARAAKAAAEAAAKVNQDLSGSGEWQVAVASHYSINFVGKGANGEPIGPYTMMCAHKTLPFGTLVEFEYNGKRCVAKVADRGPYVAGRDFDLGPGVARVLGFSGVHQVRWRIVSQ